MSSGFLITLAHAGRASARLRVRQTLLEHLPPIVLFAAGGRERYSNKNRGSNALRV